VSCRAAHCESAKTLIPSESSFSTTALALKRLARNPRIEENSSASQQLFTNTRGYSQLRPGFRYPSQHYMVRLAATAADIQAIAASVTNSLAYPVQVVHHHAHTRRYAGMVS